MARSYRYKDWAMYAQDSYKLTPRLTLNYGVRYEHYGVQHNNNQNLDSNFYYGSGSTFFEQVANGQVEIAPKSSVGQLWAPRWGTVAPRVGFAYDPFGRGKTVIRGGGGIFYSIHDRDNYQSTIQYTPPIQYNSQINYTTVQTFIDSLGYQFPSSIQGYDPNRQIQKTYNFSFGVQQDVGFGMVLDVAYVGALGRHLVVRRNLNTTPLGTNFQPQNLDPTNGNKVYPSQFLRPYLGYGDIQYYYFGGNSNYHSLQTTLRRRYKRGLTYGVVWTWSKAMDYADEDYTANAQVSNVVNQKIWNYGRAAFDRTHIFRFYWNYNLPRASGLIRNAVIKAAFDDWQVSGKLALQSGAPMGLSYTYSPSQDITGSTDAGRVLMIGNPVLPKDQRTFNQAFNTAAIAAPPIAACQVPNPPQICWGNAPKDVFRGPGVNDWDTSLFKNFPIHERMRGQFRVEAYNVFNHTQFNGVNTSAQFNAAGTQINTALGQYTGTLNPRRLQLALRVSF